MISFESDYIAGAHPEVLKRLCETNLESLPGYGTDPYCESARAKIREAIGMEDAQIEFLVGGTQTNAVIISTMLADYEGVLAAKTGHVSLHEAGAIEFTGHEVLELPQENGKILAADLEKYLTDFYGDENHEHMTFPGMVYISHPTEYGTLYTKSELTEISRICRHYDIPLYMDGARLGYGLMSRETDVTLADIARLCDVFYIGGTKVGALCGEAVVFTGGNAGTGRNVETGGNCGTDGDGGTIGDRPGKKAGKRPLHFMTSVKKRGALLAKGRLLGVQFDTLFTDGLYFRISRHAIDLAERMKEIFLSCGLSLYIDSPTNQQFVILEDSLMKRLQEDLAFSFWEKLDEGHTIVRFATSWSTTEEDLGMLENILKKYMEA